MKGPHSFSEHGPAESTCKSGPVLPSVGCGSIRRICYSVANSWLWVNSITKNILHPVDRVPIIHWVTWIAIANHSILASAFAALILAQFFLQIFLRRTTTWLMTLHLIRFRLHVYDRAPLSLSLPERRFLIQC